jgi:hypothetical protein
MLVNVFCEYPQPIAWISPGLRESVAKRLRFSQCTIAVAAPLAARWSSFAGIAQSTCLRVYGQRRSLF